MTRAAATRAVASDGGPRQVNLAIVRDSRGGERLGESLSCGGESLALAVPVALAAPVTHDSELKSMKPASGHGAGGGGCRRIKANSTG